MEIESICTNKVISIGSKSTTLEAAKAMKLHNVGCLVVFDESSDNKKPVGVLTDRDLAIEIVAAGLSGDKVLTEDIMVRHPVVVNKQSNIYEATQLMQIHGVRRLPVVDNDGNLVGILSTDDVGKLLADQIAHLTGIVDRQVSKEKEASHFQYRWQ